MPNANDLFSRRALTIAATPGTRKISNTLFTNVVVYRIAIAFFSAVRKTIVTHRTYPLVARYRMGTFYRVRIYRVPIKQVPYRTIEFAC